MTDDFEARLADYFARPGFGGDALTRDMADAIRSLRDERAVSQFNRSEIETLRQWFDALCDVNPECLERKDYELGLRIYEACGARPSNRMLTDLQKEPV